MITYGRLLSLTVCFATCGMVAVSCTNTADDCEKTATCSPISTGGRAGSDRGTGGKATGGKASTAAGASGTANTPQGLAGGGYVGAEAGTAGSLNAAGAAGAAPVLPCAGQCAEPTPFCKLLTDSCVACLSDANCPATAPACRVADSSCVVCTEDTHCSGATPVCDKATNACVACLAHANCGGASPLCKVESKTCVGCIESKDCPSGSASRCDPVSNSCAPCVANADCTNIAGRGICSAGTCVQCTGKELSACGQLDGKSLVCDSAKQVCTTDKKVQSAGPCQPCVSDAQCKVGQLCAEQIYKGKSVGYFCFWKQGDATTGAPADCTAEANRPFVNIQVGAKSVDGEIATLCTLRAVSTCTALNQYSAASSCGTVTGPDEKLCGFAHGEDSKCVPFGASQYLCTTTCLSPVDCKGSGTNSPITCDASATPSICTL